MRRGDYLGTYSGLCFWPMDPCQTEVSMDDIAHSLSQICRFNGHTAVPYSVAAHSLNVERLLQVNGHDEKVRLYGLIHDAAEAYCCDIPRLLKKFITGYDVVEANIMDAIYRHFQLPNPSAQIKELVSSADNYLLAAEAYDLMKNSESWGMKTIQDPEVLVYKDHASAEIENLFVEKFRELWSAVMGGKQWEGLYE